MAKIYDRKQYDVYLSTEGGKGASYECLNLPKVATFR